LLATAMRAKFALDITFQRQTWGDSPGAADRRSRAVEHEASGQRRSTSRMREFLLSTLSRLSDALVSGAMGEDWIPPALVKCDF